MDEALFKKDPRSYAIELCDDGLVSWESMARIMILAMSRDEVADALDANELSPRFDESEDEELENDDEWRTHWMQTNCLRVSMNRKTKNWRMTMNELFDEFDGDLYKKGEYKEPLRKDYCKHFRKIDSTSKLLATIRAGDSTDLGGYTVILITNCGEVCKPSSLAKDKSALYGELFNIRSNSRDRIVACDVFYEGPPIECFVSGEMIESAYGDPDSD